MTKVERSVLVEYSAQQMYALVEGFGNYPDFLPWCESAQVDARELDEVTATLHLNYHGVRQQFTTRNKQIPFSSIAMKLVTGPFRTLDGLWSFTMLADDACKIEFSMEYEFSSKLLEKLVGPVFNQIASTFVEAFIKRADALYAK